MNANQLSDLLSKLGNKEQSNLFDLILQPLTREKAYEDSKKYFYSLEPGLEAVFLEVRRYFAHWTSLFTLGCPRFSPMKANYLYQSIHV